MKLRRIINLYNGDAIFNSEDAGKEDPLPPGDGSNSSEVRIALQLSQRILGTYRDFQLTWWDRLYSLVSVQQLPHLRPSG